jgi:hypothetical protein
MTKYMKICGSEKARVKFTTFGEHDIFGAGECCDKVNVRVHTVTCRNKEGGSVFYLTRTDFLTIITEIELNYLLQKENHRGKLHNNK